MATHAAVGVDDDFAASEAGVALRAANDELAGGVDEVLGFVVKEVGGECFFDDVFDEKVFDGGAGCARGVLSGDDDAGDLYRLTVLIANGNLGFGIGAQPGVFAGFALSGEGATEAVGKDNGRGHQLGGFIASEAEHEALVASALLCAFFAFGSASIYALGDVGALLGNCFGDENFIGVKDVVVVDVADAADRVANDGFGVKLGFCGDFASKDDEVGFDECFAGDARVFVLGEAGVNDGVGDGVGDFVGMTFAYGFGREDTIIYH